MQNQFNIKNLKTGIVFILIQILLFSPVKTQAAVDPALYQEAKVSLTFDDGFESTYTNALPILSSKNLPATVYVTSGYIESGITDDGQPAMTWEQVQSLQNEYGWEIGGHTTTHPELPLLTTEQVANELVTANSDYTTWGLDVANFATPFGAYDNPTLVQILKYYNSHRGFADRDALNSFVYNKAVLQVQDINETTTPAVLKGWVDQAIANKQWLILVLHDVQPTLDPNYEYTVTISDFTEMAQYIKNSGIQVQTVAQALQKPGQNILVNSDFTNGITNWTVGNAAQVTVDTANNGAYSETANPNAVKMTGSAGAAHLFSSLYDVVPGANYLLEAFYNSMGLTGGELGFYIDEYDTLGNWISGQWLGMVTNNTVGFFNKFYQATSNLVSKLNVQTYLTAGSTGTAYIDNVELHDLDATAAATPAPTIPVTPTVTPTGTPSGTPTVTPSVQNLAANPSFESTTDGWADSWTRDNTGWTIDTSGKGDDGQNTAQVVMNAAKNHLFSSLIQVTNGIQYTWSTFVKTTDLTGTGEAGFYIDEYDAAGNWISGQWKGMVNAAFEGYKTFAYLPSNTLVDAVRLQYYTTANSTGTVNLDSVSFMPSVTPEPEITVTPAITPTGTPSATPTPTGTEPTVTPTLTPTGTPSVNLVSNPSFETVSGSFADNWTTDSALWLLDVTGLGNDGLNSIKLPINSQRTHLFSSLINIVANAQYTWSTYLKTANLTGEFGFYIDEYDASGNWISGQWKGMNNAPFTGNRQFSYIPTSTSVSKVRLQYYTVAGSTGDVVIDSVSMTAN